MSSLSPTPTPEQRIEALERDMAAVKAYLTSQNVAWNAAPVTVPVGSSGTMTLTPPPLSPAGWVRSKGTYANIRHAPTLDAVLVGRLTAARPILRRTSQADENGFSWYQLSDYEFVREDVVLYYADKPVAAAPSGKWKPPVSNYSITNRHNVNGHRGIDFAASHGLPVWCGPHGGVVVKAALCPKCNAQGTPRIREVSNNFGYGNYVIVRYAPETLPLPLQQGQFLYVIYAHLSAIGVSAGETLHDEDVIGFVGSTGDSTGPHLHVEARLSADANAKWGLIAPQEVDPELVFEV